MCIGNLSSGKILSFFANLEAGTVYTLVKEKHGDNYAKPTSV
jgi:hypothetical protein